MSLREVGATLARGFLDLVFAPVCLGCRGPIVPTSPARLVCPTCWSRVRPIPLPRCERCWTPLPPSPGRLPARESCPTCDTLPPSIRAVRSAFLMEGPARELVHALKYEGWRVAADPMAERMTTLPLPLETREEVRHVVAVPLGRTRMRERGYNQAALLASAVARRKGWNDASDVLERSRATDRQTALHPAERRANVAGAFRLRPGGETVVRREHLLLVDDVWTTGATTLACAAALTGAGARAVSIVTFARALADPRL